MSGYRQHSYDPNAGYEEPVPLKPYDKWQWLGRAAIGAAILLMLADLILDFGYGWSPVVKPGISFLAFFLGGMLLIRSRREPTPDEPQPEISERRRRIGGLFMIAIGIAALAYNVLASQGAN